MSTTVIVINLFTLGCFSFALVKNRTKAKQSLMVAIKSFVRILPTVLIIIVVISLLLAFAPPDQISRFIGDQSGFGGLLAIAVLGAVLYIPALLSFPLAASLLQSGAGVASVTAFITTLTMVGLATLPLEIKVLGKKFAFLRNGLSFIIAIAIALTMEAIL
ncbi:MAG: permease [Dehalococcoidia bacterium]|nr:permease [Dehalococcoidia bacterium]